jgi:hypothetical protein
VRMDYATTSPRDLAQAICTAAASRPRYRQVPRHGAARAADLLTSLIRR